MNRKKLLIAVSTCRPKFIKFFKYSLDYLKEHDKELIIRQTKIVNYKDDPSECGGWCDGDTIEIARFSNKFEEVYVHEFSHMTQAVQNSRLWDLGQESTIWEDLLSGSTDLNFWHDVVKTIRMERDCERRALRFSDQWGLFDHQQYAREANVYLYFYQYVYMTKRWHATAGLNHTDLLAMVPNKLESVANLRKINMDIVLEFEKKFRSGQRATS